MNNTVKNEKTFQEKVINHLRTVGHIILTPKATYYNTNKKQYIDIKSEYNNEIYFTEVKYYHKNIHQLQTAIGQIILHKYSNLNLRVKYQIALPRDLQFNDVSAGLIYYLKDKHNISIIFI